MTKSQERKLNQAIKTLKINYVVALDMPHIKHPLAWACYRTWMDEDTKARTTEGKKLVIKYYCTDCVQYGTENCPKRESRNDDMPCSEFEKNTVRRYKESEDEEQIYIKAYN